MRHTLRPGLLLAGVVIAAVTAFLVLRSPRDPMPGIAEANQRFLRETPAPNEIERLAYEKAARIALEASPPPADAVAQGSPQAVASGDDPEWASFPRTPFDLAAIACRETWSVRAEDLFRNAILNPRDQYIPPSARERIRAIWNGRVGGIESLQARIAPLANSEFQWLVHHGRARTKTYSEYLQSLPGPERESLVAETARHAQSLASEARAAGSPEAAIQEMVKGFRRVNFTQMFGFSTYATSNDGDRYYAAELRELPQTCDALDVYFSAVHQLVFDTVNAFVAAECLSAAGAEAVVTRLDECVRKYHPFK
ncbi:MAG: hypothetical protein IT457_07625 [Planctomycetes bacterium]|nr:hypothetical protein [Planctomycetota bacterium]